MLHNAYEKQEYISEITLIEISLLQRSILGHTLFISFIKQVLLSFNTSVILLTSCVFNYGLLVNYFKSYVTFYLETTDIADETTEPRKSSVVF